METFSLLQISLDQAIDRRSLEDASATVASVARADCARIQRELSGIVISGLPWQEALTFQAQLACRGFPTELVADRELPVLHQSFQIQRIERRGEVMVLTDSLGRERVRPLTDLVFLAAGLIQRIEFKTEWHQRFDFGGAEGGMPQLVTDREVHEESGLEFRMDFFFWADPHRLHASLKEETAIFHEGKPLRLRNDALLADLQLAMSSMLPPERLNSCLREPRSIRVYPNFQCYEKEIRWHFQRLKPRG